jgi:hypothetical protein
MGQFREGAVQLDFQASYVSSKIEQTDYYQENHVTPFDARTIADAAG